MRNVRIDKVLQRIGGFGRWQRVQLTFLAPSGLFVCWLNLIYVFIASYEHRESCDSGGHGYNSNESTSEHLDEDAAVNFTTTLEWQLTCARRWMRAVQQICFSLGGAIGVPVVYFISNRYGRKRPILITVIILTIVGSAAPYSYLYELFCIFRFISGFLAGGLSICTLLLSLETANSRFHSWIISVWDVVSATSYMLLASVASVSPDWRIIYIVSTLPVFILMTYAWLVPESPRWLLMRRRKADAERILRKIASTNGHILRRESVQHLTINEREVVSYNSYTFKNVTKDYRMCIWLLELLACRFLAFTAYHTFSYAIPNIGSEFDHHLLFQLHSWAGFVELLSVGIGLVATSFFPRKRICIIAAALSGITCAMTGVIRSRTHYVPLAALAIVGKFLIVIYTSTLQLLILELFPKEIRFNMLAATASVSYLAIGGSSVLAITAEILPFLPFMACGAAASIVAGMTILLPETFRRSADDSELEQSIATIDPPLDPAIHGGDGGAAVEMIDLRDARKTSLGTYTEIRPEEDLED